MILPLLALVLAAATPSKVDSGPTKVDSVARIDHGYPPARDVRRPEWTVDVDASVIVYSPDGRTVVTGGRDKVVRIWQARTGEDLTGELLHSFEGQTSRITAFGWRGESTLVVAAESGVVMSWDVGTGKAGPG